MADQPDLRAVRAAVRDLAQAVDDLRHASGDSPEVRRLAVDTSRLAEDIDALPGATPPEPGERPLPIHIPEGDYPLEFWADASDEGVGRN